MTPSAEDTESIHNALMACGYSSRFTATRIGEDRGFTSRCYAVGLSEKTLVAKVTPAANIHPKAIRESEILKHFAPAAQLPAPAFIGDQIDPYDGNHVLLMSHISGDGINTIATDSYQIIMHSLQSMIPCWNTPIENLPESTIVSRWGTGTKGHTTPHTRRVRRFKKRALHFLEEYSGQETSAPEIPYVVDWIREHLEPCLETAAKWPSAMIHGDLHPENIILNQNTITVLDWQTASLGSPLLDITRLLMDSVPELGADEFIECTRNLINQCDHYAHIAPHALHTSSPPIAAIIGYAGFVSGWGGKQISNMSPEEKSLVRHHSSMQGPTRLIRELIPRIEL